VVSESGDRRKGGYRRAGELADVIASRGGLAAPEAPFVIEHREALIYMLCEAAELEHGIMCQYLFAACSLKQSLDEGLTPKSSMRSSDGGGLSPLPCRDGGDAAPSTNASCCGGGSVSSRSSNAGAQS
jgi:hypothetical protein